MITTQQWRAINIDMLGLRSEDNTTEIKSAASYAMDCGKKWSDPIPENWMDLLEGTIKMMQGFEGYKTRYLLIVSPSSSDNFEYSDCFPKCSSKPSSISAYTSLNDSVSNLMKWVVGQIH